MIRLVEQTFGKKMAETTVETQTVTRQDQPREDRPRKDAVNEEAPAAAAAEGTMGLDEAADALARFTREIQDVERGIARAVLMAAPLLRCGVCEKVEGMTLELWLADTCRLIKSDRHTLLTASEVLQAMPVVAGLFADGQLSWGQVRNICRKAARLDRHQQATLDARLEATMARWRGLDVFDPDELLWAADDAIAEMTDPDVRRKERDGAKRSFLALQPDLFGDGGDFFGHADAPGFALLSNALDRACAHPDPTDETTTNDHTDGGGGGDGGDDGGGDDGDADGDSWERTYRRRANHQGLMTILGEWMGGSSGRPARPAFVLHVPV
ncbi:MAG: DUF222 domain-containing protein, partial [Nitriliruptorales bacterium]